jgi:hypothetical protein
MKQTLDGEDLLVRTIGESETLPATAPEVRAPLRAPVFLLAEKDQPVTTLAVEDDTPRTLQGALL